MILFGVLLKEYYWIIYANALAHIVYLFLDLSQYKFKIAFVFFKLSKNLFVPSIISLYLLLPSILILFSNSDDGEQLIENKIATIFSLITNNLIFDFASQKQIRRKELSQLLFYCALILILIPIASIFIVQFVSYDLSLSRILYFLIGSVLSLIIMYTARRLQIINSSEAIQFDKLRITCSVIGISLVLFGIKPLLALFVTYFLILIFYHGKKIVNNRI